MVGTKTSLSVKKPGKQTGQCGEDFSAALLGSYSENLLCKLGFVSALIMCSLNMIICSNSAVCQGWSVQGPTKYGEMYKAGK